MFSRARFLPSFVLAAILLTRRGLRLEQAGLRCIGLCI